MSVTNLYPPIVTTYMPGFISANGINIYFSISEYNSISDIANAQITIVNQYSNLTALDSTKYPSQIMLKQVQTDNTRADDKYYVHINASDIQGGVFEINTFYKVQIRFTSTDATSIALTTPQQLDSWLALNLSHFSEWSSVCLIRAISQPTLTVSGYDIQEGHIVWSMANSRLLGTLTFEDSAETDSLNSYRIRLYNSNNELLTDSGILYTDNFNNPNSFTYTFKYGFVVGESYYFTVDYSTQTMYENTTQINFSVIQDSVTDYGFTFSAKLDDNNGRVRIQVGRSATSASYTGKIAIRRSSSESDFTIWEDIFVKSYSAVTSVRDTWYDNTIQGGVWYKYALQVVNTDGSRGFINVGSKLYISTFEDMFLSTKDRQLKIKFNQSISNFKQVISEAKIETIGSQYPYIRRNGAVNYAQFPISGLISFQADEDQVFFTDKELYEYDDVQRKYNKMYTNSDWPITDNNNYIKEKKYRDAVIAFLNDGKPKLFRTMTEGNYIIRLMDISFTPNQQLGRMIWSFTANALEIDENTVDNYELYDIIAERG